MDDHLSLPADGDVDALLDDWLATPPAAARRARHASADASPHDALPPPPPAAAAALPPPVEEPAAPSRLSDAATLLEALAVDAAAAAVPLATRTAPPRLAARAGRHL